jgi:nucleotidyltransferase substrate binding protein (TIGR01987 family)
MEQHDIRWKQRFQNFEKAILQLQDAVVKNNLSKLEKAGVIQVYEFTFELAWKTLKDFLEEKLVDVKYPRDTIKESFSFQLIKNGDVWMDMLDKRNLMSHTYDDKTAELAYRLIVDVYYQALYDVYTYLKNEA